MDRYRIETPLGEGAMAQVYRAMDLSLNRPVALKFLKASAADRPVVRQRFLREATAAARLSHPNIVRVYDAGEMEGRLFLALELVPGPTLEKVLEEDAPPLRRITEWMEQIARGIHHAHQHGVIHRDLKPANIIISETGDPKVADFGLAHLVESESALTQSGTTLGTPLFMSPEQVAGHAKEISPRTDVYALGAILYQGLTGQTPHLADTIAQLYRKILHEIPREPRKLNPEISPDLETICLKALEKEPSRRYATAEAFAEDLKRHVDGEPIRAKPLTAWNRMVRSARRNKAISAAVAALLVVVLGMGLALGIQRAKSENRAGALQRLSTLWATITERKRDLRQLKSPPEQARRDLENAVSEMAGHIKDWPDDPLGYYVRARGRLFLGDLEGAAKDIGIALTLRRDFHPAWSLLGMVKVDQYQESLWTDIEHSDEATKINHPLLNSAIEAFSRGWETGREQEEARRWGLPWTREDQVMERLARALKLAYQDRKSGEAREILKEGSEEYQAEEYAHYLGILNGEPATRLHWLDRALEWGPGYAPALMDRGSMRLKQGNYSGASIDFDRAIELKKDFVQAYLNRGHLRKTRGDLMGALADFNRAIELKGDYMEAYNNRGNVRQLQEDYSGARADFDRAIELKGNYPGAFNNRGRLKQLRGDYAGALADYDHAIELKKDFADPYSNRGTLKEGRGDLPGAYADYDRAIQLKSDYEQAYVNRGNLKDLRKDYAGALADFNQAIQLKPDFAMAYFRRGGLRYSQGDAASALADYDRAIEFKKDYAEAFVNRGSVKQGMGDRVGAMADYDRAIDLREDLPEPHYLKGHAKQSQGDFPGALAAYDRAIELRKDFTEAYMNRAQVKEQLGNLSGSIADLRKALESAPPDWPHRTRVESWLREHEGK